MKKNRSKRSLSSSKSAETPTYIRMRSVHLRKDQLSTDLLKQKIKQVVQVNEVKEVTIVSSDEEQDRVRATDLTYARIEVPDQIVREGREAITEGSPTGDWTKYHFARENIQNTPKDQDYYECFKLFDRAQQLVDGLKLTPNLYIDMLKDSQSKNHFPKSLGIPKQNNLRFTLNVRRQLLGQGRYSNMMGLVLQHLPATQCLDLADNQLTSEKLNMILSEVKEGIQRIDLSNNKINGTVHMNLHFNSLKTLILTNTALTDDALKMISSSISRSLRVLNLSHNQLTDNCCKYLPIGEDNDVQELYLNWNKIQGKGGQQIFQTLLSNSALKVPNQIYSQVLDLSYNALGHPQKLCFGPLHTILILPHPEMVHLDLSHNQFSQDDCQDIAISLKGNQQLYGLHIIGNQEWYIDPEGWAVDRSRVIEAPTEIQHFKGVQIDIDEINEQLRYMIALQELEDELNNINCKHLQNQIHSIDFQGENKYQNKRYDLFDNCWICEGWQDIRFEWKPIVSGHLKVEPMYVHLDFLQYKPIQLQYFNNSFVAYKMCPPNRQVIYFYSNPVEQEQLLALDQPVIELPEDHPLRKKEQFRPIISYEDKTHIRSNQLIRANVVNTTHGVIFNKQQDFLLMVNSQPRGTFRHKDLLDYLMRQNALWNQQNSIFKNFQGDTELLLDQCFEHDYTSSRILKLCDDEDQSNIVKETLRPYYRYIFHGYKYYASMSMNLNVPSVSLPYFIEMISRTKIMSTGMRPTDIQVLFISSSSKDNSSSGDRKEYLVDKSVIRHQFMEMIVRLAIDKHGKRGTNVQDCISKVLHEDKLLDWLMTFDISQDWRNLRFWNFQSDELLSIQSFKQEQPLYLYGASLNIKLHTHRTKMMQYKDFLDLCEKAGISSQLKEREIMNIYLLSIQSSIDEIHGITHFLMGIIEFMEALARLAERLSPCREEGRTLKQRRLQTLPRKLFVLLWIMYRQLKPEIKRLYVRKSLDYRDFEGRLFRDLLRPKTDAPSSQQQKATITPDTSPAKTRIRVTQSLDRLKQSPSKQAPAKKPVFNLQQLLGITENALPTIRKQRTRYFKEAPRQVEQYDVMKCINFFLNNK